MSNRVPHGWIVSQINDTCDVFDYMRIPLNTQERALRKGRYPYYGANGVQGYIDDYIFDGEYVLLAEDGGYFDQWSTRPISYLVTGKFWVNNHAHILKAKAGHETKYVHYSLVHKNILEHINGGTRSKLNQSDMRNIEYLTPPLPEQQKIATILSSVDNVIEKTRAQIDKLKDLKTGMMQELLTKGIGHTEFKDSPVGRIPTAWNIVAQGDVAKFFNGRAYKLTEWEDTGTPVIRLQNLTGSGRNFYYSTLQLPERQYCEKGDLLYMWSATFGPHIWQGPKAIYHYHIWKVEADETKIKKAFLFYLLDFKTKQWKEQSSNGMGILHVTKGAMEEMELALPPISEQQQIATALQATDLKLELSQQQLEYRLKIKKALMQDLLTGKVRVNLTDKESAVV